MEIDDLDSPNGLKEVDLLMVNIKQQKKLMEAPVHLSYLATKPSQAG
jgi:hypothetical protein